MVGDCALAGGSIRRHLDLVHLDKVFGPSPLAVDVLVEMLGLTGQGAHDVAGVEAQCRRLKEGDDPALRSVRVKILVASSSRGLPVFVS